MRKTNTLFFAVIVGVLGVPSAYATVATKAFPVNDHIQVAVGFNSNDLGHRDNQYVSIYFTHPSIPANYIPCANRVRIEQPPAGAIHPAEDATEARGATSQLWIAHDPEAHVVDDQMWVFNANGADVRWTLKGVTGYYLPSGGDDSARIIECKKAATREAEASAPGGLPLGTPDDDDNNPHVW